MPPPHTPTAQPATGAGGTTPPVRHGLRAAWRQRVQRWFEQRLPRSDRWTLTQRTIYIVPTKAGWGFALTLVVMLLASINYQLNLGYALTFLLGGAALVSLQQTHANLRRLTLHLKPPQPVFAGSSAALDIVLDNPGAARHGIGLGLYARGGAGLAWVDVPALGSAAAQLRVVSPTRGRHPVPTLLVRTQFPLGLFRAWTVWAPAATLLVYPAPEQPAPPFPAAAAASAGGELALRSAGGSEFDGVRAWRRGDSQRQVVWKKVARSGELVSRDSSAAVAQSLHFDYAQAGRAGAVDAEARLRRLCAWVLAAEQRSQPFGLRLPGVELGVAGGAAQTSAALTALALWRG